ncbi:hypothetical protein ACN42_g11498, partial [Penicillium freii]
QHIITN